MKVCSRCKIEKSYNDFYKHNKSKDGKQSNCKSCHYEISQKWKHKNQDKVKSYRDKWMASNKEYLKNKRKLNLIERRKYMNEYTAKRRKSDPMYKIICYNRTRISFFFKKIKLKKTTNTITSIGISLFDFKKYIQSKFQEGMTWDNYGDWHIDHIKPLSMATTQEEIIKLNHYTNLQPLWAIDNIKKSNKYE